MKCKKKLLISNINNGKGLMLGGISGLLPTSVVIIGAGTVGEYAWRRTQEFRLSFQYRINQNKRRGGQRGGFDSSEFEGGSGIFGN